VRDGSSTSKSKEGGDDAEEEPARACAIDPRPSGLVGTALHDRLRPARHAHRRRPTESLKTTTTRCAALHSAPPLTLGSDASAVSTTTEPSLLPNVLNEGLDKAPAPSTPRSISRSRRRAMMAARHAALANQIRSLPFADLASAEIAERLGIPESHVRECCSAHEILHRGRRIHKPIESPLFSMNAELVEEAYPNEHAEFQRIIYDERAPAVRARMKAFRIKKANMYPVDPIVLDAINPRQAGIDLWLRERFE